MGIKSVSERVEPLIQNKPIVNNSSERGSGLSEVKKSSEPAVVQPFEPVKPVKRGEEKDIRERLTEEEKKNEVREPDEKQIQKAVDHVNKAANQVKCEFSYHEATHRVSIRVIDKETEEVIKEIPPEKSLEMLQKMWELAGILVDEKR